MRFSLKTDYAQDIRLIRRSDQAFGYGLTILIMLGLPYLINPYWLSQISFVLIYAVAGLGLMLLAGYTGLISIGHAAFLGIGAYTEAFLIARGWPFPVAMIAAGVLSAAAGVVIGLPALRVKGIYLAIATLAFGFIAEEVMSRWEFVTGGNSGLQVKAPAFLGWQFRSQESIYYLSLIVCLLVTLGVLNLLRCRPVERSSRFGTLR